MMRNIKNINDTEINIATRCIIKTIFVGLRNYGSLPDRPGNETGSIRYACLVNIMSHRRITSHGSISRVGIKLPIDRHQRTRCTN